MCVVISSPPGGGFPKLVLDLGPGWPGRSGTELGKGTWELHRMLVSHGSLNQVPNTCAIDRKPIVRCLARHTQLARFALATSRLGWGPTSLVSLGM